MEHQYSTSRRAGYGSVRRVALALAMMSATIGTVVAAPAAKSDPKKAPAKSAAKPTSASAKSASSAKSTKTATTTKATNGKSAKVTPTTAKSATKSAAGTKSAPTKATAPASKTGASKPAAAKTPTVKSAPVASLRRSDSGASIRMVSSRPSSASAAALETVEDEGTVLNTSYRQQNDIAAAEAPRPGFFSRVFGGIRRILPGGGSSEDTANARGVETEGYTVGTSSLQGMKQSGMASWYGGRWHGGPTASGERYNQNSYTAAHKTLPFGTLVKVTNNLTGKDVVVRINNRGPYVRGRILDLSKSAAQEIGVYSRGVAPVSMQVVGRASRG